MEVGKLYKISGRGGIYMYAGHNVFIDCYGNTLRDDTAYYAVFEATKDDVFNQYVSDCRTIIDNLDFEVSESKQ